MKKKLENKENYLEKIPLTKPTIDWEVDDNNKVTLKIENTGIFNFLAQKLLKKPRYSKIHLDDLGSFVWGIIDGEKNIITIGKLVSDKFGDTANPLYERLAQFFKTLESYGFIEWK